MYCFVPSLARPPRNPWFFSAALQRPLVRKHFSWLAFFATPTRAPDGTPAAGAAVVAKAAVPKGLESFYNQTVEWYDCGATGGMEESADRTGFQCAQARQAQQHAQCRENKDDDTRRNPCGTPVGTRNAPIRMSSGRAWFIWPIAAMC